MSKLTGSQHLGNLVQKEHLGGTLNNTTLRLDKEIVEDLTRRIEELEEFITSTRFLVVNPEYPNNLED